VLGGFGWQMGRKEGITGGSQVMREARVQDPIFKLAQEKWRENALKEINDSWLTNGNEKVPPEILDSLVPESEKEEFILGVIKENFGDQGVSAYISGKNQALKDATKFVLMDFGKMFIGYGSQIDPTKPKGFDPIDNKKNEITNESLRDQEWLYAYGYNHSIDGYYNTGTLLSMAVPSNFIKLTEEFKIAQKYSKVISEVFDENRLTAKNQKIWDGVKRGLLNSVDGQILDSIPTQAEIIKLAEYASKHNREINIIFDETTKTSKLIVGEARKILFNPKSNLKILAHIHPGGNPLPSIDDANRYFELLKMNPKAGKLKIYTNYGLFEYNAQDLEELKRLKLLK
jgi:hypothetical protein